MTGAHVETRPLPWEPGPILSALLLLWTPGPQGPDWAEPRPWRALSRDARNPQLPKSLRVKVSRATSWQPVGEAAPPLELAIALNLHTPACPVPLRTHLAHILRTSEGAFSDTSPGLCTGVLTGDVHACLEPAPPKSPCSWAWTWLLGAAHNVPHGARPAHRVDTPTLAAPERTRARLFDVWVQRRLLLAPWPGTFQLPPHRVSWCCLRLLGTHSQGQSGQHCHCCPSPRLTRPGNFSSVETGLSMYGPIHLLKNIKCPSPALHVSTLRGAAEWHV